MSLGVLFIRYLSLDLGIFSINLKNNVIYIKEIIELLQSLEENYVAFNKKHHVDFVDFLVLNTKCAFSTRK